MGPAVEREEKIRELIEWMPPDSTSPMEAMKNIKEE